MSPFGQEPMLVSRGSVSHVAKVRPGRVYRVVLQQSEPLLLALHWHRNRSVLCLGGEDECAVCFSEGTHARWYAFWVAQELVEPGAAHEILGRRAIMEVPYMTYVWLQRKLADRGNSGDHFGLAVEFQRLKSLRSPVLVTIIGSRELDPASRYDPRMCFDVVARWIGLEPLNGDILKWKEIVRRRVRSDDFYGGAVQGR